MSSLMTDILPLIQTNRAIARRLLALSELAPTSHTDPIFHSRVSLSCSLSPAHGTYRFGVISTGYHGSDDGRADIPEDSNNEECEASRYSTPNSMLLLIGHPVLLCLHCNSMTLIISRKIKRMPIEIVANSGKWCRDIRKRSPNNESQQIAFAAALGSFLRRFEGESATLSSILFGAGVAAGIVSLLQGLFTQVLADPVAAIGNAAAIRTLFNLNGDGDTYKLLALGVFLGATALLVFSTHTLPHWIGWIAAVLAPLLVIAGWNFALSTSVQYVAYAVLLVVLLFWIAALSVISLRLTCTLHVGATLPAGSSIQNVTLN